MEEFNDTSVRTADESSVFASTFFKMFLGLLASSITAVYAYYSGLYATMVDGAYIGLIIAELIVVLVFSFCFRKLPATVVTVLYFAYAFLNGFTLSVIFAIYDLGSICYCFIGAAALFGIMAIVGYKMKQNISFVGPILLVTMLIGIIVSIINIFLNSSGLAILLNWAVLILFAGVTIYDMNRLKNAENLEFAEGDKLSVYFAMQLYLDFINVFLRILALFGKRK